MERVTLRVPEKHLDEIEELVEAGEYPNRSEFVRTGIREKLEEHRGADHTWPWKGD